MRKTGMKLLMLSAVIFFSNALMAQCSICTKTAQQLGEKTGEALNGAIIYLAAAPILIVSFISYRWWKQNKPK